MTGREASVAQPAISADRLTAAGYAAAVHHFRALFSHRRACWLLLTLALAMRLLMPGGYMPDRDGGALTVTICDGGAGRQLALAIPGLGASHQQPEHRPEHGKAPPACAFAALTGQAVAAVDGILLLAAIAYIVLYAARAVAPARSRAAPFLRPPPRAPPAFR